MSGQRAGRLPQCWLIPDPVQLSEPLGPWLWYELKLWLCVHCLLSVEADPLKTRKTTDSSLGAKFQQPDLTELGISSVALYRATNVHLIGQLELKSERQEKQEYF